MAAGLYCMIAQNDKPGQAVRWVNAHRLPGETHKLSRSSLLRMFATVPQSLRHPATSSEGQLLEHVHSYQSAQRKVQNLGKSLLTIVEEELLVDWIVRQCNMNAPASPEEVKDRARGLVEQRTGQKYETPLRSWYAAFLRRHPDLSVRIPENMPKSRLNAEQKHANIAHFFSIVAQLAHVER